MIQKDRSPLRGHAFLLILCALLVVALPALGARGGKGSGGSGGGGGKGKNGGAPAATGTIDELVLVESTDGVAHHGQHITFRVTSTARYFFVAVSCSQDGVRVYRQDIGFYVGWPWSQDFTLMSGAWTGGAANCDAELYSQLSDGSNHQTLDALPFNVEA